MVESCSVLKTVIIMWPRRGENQPQITRNLRLIFPLRGQ